MYVFGCAGATRDDSVILGLELGLGLGLRLGFELRLGLRLLKLRLGIEIKEFWRTEACSVKSDVRVKQGLLMRLKVTAAVLIGIWLPFHVALPVLL